LTARIATAQAPSDVWASLRDEPTGDPEVYRDWLAVTNQDWRWKETQPSGIRHAVVLFDGVIIDDRFAGSDGNSSFSRYRRLLVLDTDAVERYRSVELPYDKATKITALQARVLKRDGRVMSPAKKEIYDKVILSYQGRSIKARVFAFPGVEPGDIIEYLFVQKMPIERVPRILLREDLYVAKKLVICNLLPVPVIPRELFNELKDFVFQPDWHLLRADDLTKRVQVLPDRNNPKRLEIECRDLRPMPDEPYMPPLDEIAPFFVRSYRFPYQDKKKPYWGRVAEAYGEATRQFVAGDKALRKWLEPVSSGPRDLDRDLEGCFRLIQGNIKNSDFPDSLGQALDDPECKDVSKVVSGGRGNTEDINRVLVRMLQRLGYTATIFWIKDRTQGLFEPKWESLSQFTLSGVAVQAGSGFRWLFPGMPHAVPRSMPWPALDSQALLESPPTGKPDPAFPLFSQTPSATADSNRIELVARLRPDPDGSLRGRLTVTWRCLNNPGLVAELQGEGAKETCDRVRPEVLSPQLIPAVRDESATASGLSIVYRCSLAVEGAAVSTGGRTVLTPGSIRGDDYRFTMTGRETEIHFRHPINYASKVIVELPAGYQVETLPAEDLTRTDAASHRMKWNSEDGAVVVNRDLKIGSTYLEASDARPLAEFFEHVYLKTREAAVLRVSESPDSVAAQTSDGLPRGRSER
jgi:hypothetical protein